mmetsp:Transcript_40082/g.98507  ORF Transcript_40082/g.98507 Transcript_40082/m.98507 type:complete len:606 (+) Transcript_40082:120-1937(+)
MSNAEQQGLADAVTFLPILLDLLTDKGATLSKKGFFESCQAVRQDEGQLMELVGKKGMIGAAIKELKAQLKNPEVAFNGCTFLGNLTIGSDERKSRVVSDNGIDFCVGAMKAHVRDQDLQTAGCRLLGNLASWKKDAAAKVHKAKGAEAAVEAMDVHVRDATLQQSACFLCCKLTDQLQKDFAKKFADGKGIDLALKAMDTHAFDERVQGFGCALLCSLVRAYEKLRPRISQTLGVGNAMQRIGAFSRTKDGCLRVVFAGGIGLALQTIKDFSTEPPVVCSSLHLLTNLVKDSGQVGQRVSDEGGVALCVNAMKSSQDLAVQKSGCTFFAAAANSDAMAPRLVGEGVIRVIMAAMQMGPEDPELLYKALKTLNSMAANKEDVKQKLMDEGVIKLAVGALQIFKQDVSVQMEGILVLSTLSRGSSERAQFVTSAGGIGLAIKGMRFCKDNEDVQESGLNLLLAMAQLDDLQRSNLLMMEGAVGAVFRAMPMGGRDSRIRKWSAQILGLLAKSSVENAAKIRSEWALFQGREENVCRCCGIAAEETGIKMLKCGECTIGPTFCSPECWRDYSREHLAECKANPIAPPDGEQYVAPIYREQRKRPIIK